MEPFVALLDRLAKSSVNVMVLSDKISGSDVAPLVAHDPLCLIHVMHLSQGVVPRIRW